MAGPAASRCTQCGAAIDVLPREGDDPVTLCRPCLERVVLPARFLGEAAAFARMPELSVASVRSRPLPPAIPGLLLVLAIFAVLVGGTTALAFRLWGGAAWGIAGLVALLVANGVAQAFVVRGAHPLDVRRWRVFGAAFVVSTIVVVTGSHAIGITFASAGAAYASFAIPPLLIAAWFVSARDRAQKDAVVTHLQVWRAVRARRSSEEPARPEDRERSARRDRPAPSSDRGE